MSEEDLTIIRNTKIADLPNLKIGMLIEWLKGQQEGVGVAVAKAAYQILK
jgi:hypothetical protein